MGAGTPENPEECMKYDLIVRPEAEAELAEAFNWYEQKIDGLGSRFLISVDAAINSIQRDPLQYPIIYKNVHRALTRRFPYQIFFIVDDLQIVVIAVFHGMRNPSVWQSRK
jgi:plasmid stabilization system protein ParE